MELQKSINVKLELATLNVAGRRELAIDEVTEKTYTNQEKIQECRRIFLLSPIVKREERKVSFA